LVVNDIIGSSLSEIDLFWLLILKEIKSN